MEPSSFLEDEEGLELLEEAKKLFRNGDYNKALAIIEDLILASREDEDSWFLNYYQGEMFLKLTETSANSDVVFLYTFGRVVCHSEDVLLSRLCAAGFYHLGRLLGSVLYYKNCVEIAKQSLSVTYPNSSNSAAHEILRSIEKDSKEALEDLIKKAEFEIAASKKCPLKRWDTEVRKSKNIPAEHKGKNIRLSSYWMGLDVNVKRDFMKVNIAKLISFVEGEHNRLGRDALEQILTSAREDRKWTFWMCRTICSKKFSSDKECTNHLEEQHDADFKPYSEDIIVKRIGKAWAGKISVGNWEPVDAVAAVEMIKNRLAYVTAFALKTKTGWSKEWPLAVDEERRKLLKKIKLLLMSLFEKKVLSCSMRDWVMDFPVKHLGKLEVSKQSLIDSLLTKTPQSICFLECHELNQILDFLKKIKSERNDGTDLVCRAADSILDSTQVKENIDFDPQFSFLLMDRRLLKSSKIPFDAEETINVFDPNVHYAKAQVQGDDIISWLTENISLGEIFPRPIREHNLDIWVAVRRAVQLTCSSLETKYAKKVLVLDYAAALTDVENLCMREDERRRNLLVDQWKTYASLLCDKCEERVPENPLTAKLFVCAVRDVLTGALHLTFEFPDFEDCLNLIRERKSLSDDIALKSIDFLKSVATHKVLLIDSKILLIDNSRTSLLDRLTKLSVFDNRTYILQLLKLFLLNEIVNMESKAKSDAAEADLLLEEEKKSQPKKKKNTSKKNNSSSMSNPHDKTVEHKASVNVEAEITSPSLKTVEGDSPEPEDTLASQKGRLEISSNIVNQEDIQNMPGEGLLPKHVDTTLIETAARYNSALDMTLKDEIVNMETKANSEAAEDKKKKSQPKKKKNKSKKDEILKIESKAKSEAAEADLVVEEKKKSQPKKKKNKSKTKTSTSMASSLDKTVEHKHSVNVEPESISLSLKTVAGDSLEPEDSLASGLEILSKTESQDQANKDDPDMQNMPGEDSQSEVLESAHGEVAVKYNSAVNMTLKSGTRRVPPTTAQETTWTPPTRPYLKCNIGCMWVNTDENCGAAWILRDHMGSTLLHGRRSYSNVPSQFEAELVSLLWAVESIGNMGKVRNENIIFEMSSRQTIEALENPNGCPALRDTILEIQNHLNKISGWRMELAPNMCNQAAQRIAKSVTDEQRYQSYIASNGPPWLQELLESEARRSTESK